MRYGLTRLLPFVTLLLLPCLLLWPVVFGGEMFLPADLLRDIAPWRGSDTSSLVPWNPLMWDGMAEFYPWRLFAAETLKSGYLPLWNPHQFCGTPFVANSQSAVFYPFNLLFCLLPVSRAFGISVLLHLFLTGIFAYCFLRSPALGLGRAASLVGAASWQLCHWQVAWLALPTFLCVSAWLPLALLLTDRAVQRPSPTRAVPLGLCLGIMLLAGHLQIALYCLGMVTAYALFRLLPRLKKHWPTLLGCAVLVLALAFGLAAPQLLPTVELARMSHRAGGPATWAAYQGYVRLAMPPINLVTLFLPGFFGSPTRGTYWGIGLNGGPGAYMENACYGGVLTLLLALTGLTATWRTNSATRFFAVAAIISLLLALGTPLNALPFFGLPGFSQTGSPGRILVLWSFCVSVLAASGAETALRADWRALRHGLSAFAALFSLTLGYAAIWISHYAPAGTLAANLAAESDLWRLPVGLLLGLGAGLWLWKRGSLTTPMLEAALVFLVSADLLASGYGFNRTATAQSIYPITPIIAYLQQHRAEGRIMPLNHRWSLTSLPPPAVLPPNAATVYGLDDTQGYDSLLTGQYFQFAGAMDSGSPAPPENGNMVFTNGYGSLEAQAASVRFVVSRKPLAEGFLTKVMQDNGVYVYENMQAMPRIRENGGEGKFRLDDSVPTRLLIQGDGDQQMSAITVADQWYPGWQVWFDRQPATVTPGPYVFRTLSLTPQMQEASRTEVSVAMRYEPEAFRVGLYALCLALGSAAAIMAAALTLCLPGSRRRLG
ncbi:MAG: YfhO family protein [Armatimonadota bacterium]|nr:YfhO family protein [Armatimonadota bacterium]